MRLDLGFSLFAGHDRALTGGKILPAAPELGSLLLASYLSAAAVMPIAVFLAGSIGTAALVGAFSGPAAGGPPLPGGFNPDPVLLLLGGAVLSLTPITLAALAQPLVPLAVAIMSAEDQAAALAEEGWIPGASSVQAMVF